MLQATFINRRALYLRPDPARVIVRPFKPTTEPRDLNPTDKTRANHIVERVLNLDPQAAADNGRIDQCPVTADHAGLLQPTHPPEAGRWRQANPGGEFGVADTAVLFQHGQY